MKRLMLLLLVVASAAAVFASENQPPRNQTEKRHFAKLNPCPATGLLVPSCKGYVIDHVVPLCAGGEDKALNMQWQKLDVSRLKDRIEKASCACIRKHGAAACPVITWK